MRAIMYYGKQDVRVVDVPEPECIPYGVKVAVKWCGICGGDLRAYLVGPDANHPAGSLLGHEFVGDVVEIGNGVENFKVGDRVLLGHRGDAKGKLVPRLSEAHQKKAPNFFGISGAFAKFIVKHEDLMVKLDSRLSYEDGVIVEPLEVGVSGVKKSNLKIGETVFVAGAGPIGLMTFQAARAAGASRVFISDQFDLKKKAAQALGADAVLDFTKCDVPQEVRRLTEGRGVDVAFQCSQPSLKECVAAVAEGGRVIVMAAHTQPIALDWRYDILYRGVSIRPSLGASFEDIICSMDLLASGRVKSDYMATAEIGLDDFVSKGVERMARGEEIKVLVKPD
jgi:(R,R)-butanediol dehydrogenase/meso-butanediol dehydrogenase/diacetyl reductase